MKTITTRTDDFDFEGSILDLLVVRVSKDAWGDEIAVVWESNAAWHTHITHFNANGETVCFGQYTALGDLPVEIERLAHASTERSAAVEAWYNRRAREAQAIVEAALGRFVGFDRHGRFLVERK